MATLRSLLRRVANALLRPSTATGQQSSRPPVPSEISTVVGAASPGRSGPTATTEVDPHRVGGVSLSYNPVVDGDPDPGEIVWTWVPYEERDGRGKDRPVLVVARTTDQHVLAVQLTSKDHSHEGDFVPLGAGPWDSAGRPSWANLDRVFRVHPAGMRREAAQLPKDRFVVVAAALRSRYGWR
ncbi:type II toxin-antitoxin system PemK/MazF family toxin [Plantibacter sp. RU18]|uniref:type II toxin-antitoxin system PemK/MazF family toxin n=1 Tax=Plantibacter sp. RU18 TaxID=3158143 RepID=UPI003D36ADB6